MKRKNLRSLKKSDAIYYKISIYILKSIYITAEMFMPL